ncbi:protein RUFY3 isoform X3 [Pararge aegeria]|uniref:protein RUFY3 isoform X3 n=1 Tax=Pararge aegeria TaxID=116150 RepID=UPI0019CFE52D|nr:protein RUFY3 isoform X3 [Pararge aegeria]
MRSLTAAHGVEPLPELGLTSGIQVEDNPDADMAGAQDTIYLCNFRVSVDGEWLCLKELHDMEMQNSYTAQSDNGAMTSPDDPMHSLMARDPVVIERSNLVNISKLIVKELIEQSLRYGRMLDSDHLPLHHFFIVLEHVMRHGLKPKKGLLGPKKELWDILQMVEKYSPEAADITASIRDLPTVKTAMGRARAWLRLALMQKRLADYLRILLEHREETLEEYFEPHALMLNEEAVIITGLLVGLNVVDCNLCVKEEDLDSQQGVIDFSLYLRGSNSSNELAGNGNNGNNEPKQRHINTMLDQKNYIEELNRHLNATVTNLQSKVEGLTTTNALMKEDLAIAKNTMIQLVEENNQLKHALGQDLSKDSRMKVMEVQADEEEKRSVKSNTSDKYKHEKESELGKSLEEEKKKNMELQKELDLQISLKAEMEVAMKLLEKDIHDKQDTIISLRRQLDDIKLINLEMYKKLQEDKNVRKNLEENSRSLGQKAAIAETRAVAAEGDLRIEREWRISLQESMMRDRDKISILNQEVESLKSIGQKYIALQEEQHQLKIQYSEAQKTLEEVGATLSENKLQLAEMLEKEAKSTDETPNWTSDKDAVACAACAKEFNIARRKHHCRRCGHIFCGACSEKTVALVGNTKPVRVCDACFVEVRLT